MTSTKPELTKARALLEGWDDQLRAFREALEIRKAQGDEGASEACGDPAETLTISDLMVGDVVGRAYVYALHSVYPDQSPLARCVALLPEIASMSCAAAMDAIDERYAAIKAEQQAMIDDGYQERGWAGLTSQVELDTWRRNVDFVNVAQRTLRWLADYLESADETSADDLCSHIYTCPGFADLPGGLRAVLAVVPSIVNEYAVEAILSAEHGEIDHAPLFVIE